MITKATDILRTSNYEISNEDDLKVPIEFPPEPGSLAFLSPSDGSS